jgi:hypothetical protein
VCVQEVAGREQIQNNVVLAAAQQCFQLEIDVHQPAADISPE